MEISNVQHQAMTSNNQLEQVLGCTKPAQQQQQQQQQQQEKRSRPHPTEQALKCPRCDSSNTKFCYYNNYSLSQPRYFCKGCRRYWTQGGSLRNVPVGGGCRKNKRSSSSSSSSTSSSSSSKRQHDQTLLIPNPIPPLLPSLPPSSIPYDPNGLSLSFNDTFFFGSNPNPSLNQMTCAPAPGFLDILRTGLLDSNVPSGFQNLCYGFGGTAGNNGGDVEAGWGEEVVVPLEGGLATRGATTSPSTATATTTSQGSSNTAVEHGGENKLVVGLQWHSGGEGSNVGLDPGREYWNGIGSSSWHGLINSSLM